MGCANKAGMVWRRIVAPVPMWHEVRFLHNPPRYTDYLPVGV